MPLKIRKAKPIDAAAISGLILPLVTEFVSHEYTKQGNEFALGSMSEKNILSNINQDIDYFVAETENRLVGILGIKQGNHLYHCFVSKDYHRQKIGEQLWNYWLSKSNAYKVTVNSSKYAIKFYQSLGFVYNNKTFEKNGIVSYPMIFNRSIA